MAVAHAEMQNGTGVGDADRVLATLNEFLCEEISASQTYRVTAERVAGGRDAPYLGLLRQFEEEHDLAAEAIRQQIGELNGEPADACGSWGAWSKAVHCVKAGLFGGHRDGNGSPLECLRDGELHNLEDYIANLARVDPAAAQLLRNQLIPAQQRHVRMLSELIGGSSGTGA